MNNTFSFSRFGRYFATEFMASRHRFFTMIWLTAAIHIGLILISAFLFQNTIANANSDIYTIALIGIGVTAAVMISHSFRGYHNSMSAPRMMMLPASRSEKFTYSFFYNAVIIPAILLGIVILIHAVIGVLAPTEVETVKNYTIQGIMMSNHPYAVIVIDVLFYSSIYLLGAALFRRAPFVLTTVSLVGILTLVGWVFMTFLFPTLTDIKVNRGDTMFMQTILDFDLTSRILTYCAIPVVIALAWLRFRSLQLKK